MPDLEWLEIGFNSPVPNRDVVRQLLNTPTITHVTLPNLRRFRLRCVSAFLEGLLARISAPLLSVFEAAFSNQLTFTIPHLSQLIQTSENLTFNAIQLKFGTNLVTFSADPHRKRQQQPLVLQILCRHLDWQVALAVQILASLSPVLSAVEQLTLLHDEHDQSSEWHDEVDRAQWRELLQPFTNVKVLHLDNELVRRLSHSLCSEDGEMTMEVLPNLKEVTHPRGDIGDVFTAFINEREAAGRLVRLKSRL
jgi:hypothetical protein